VILNLYSETRSLTLGVLSLDLTSL